MKTKVFSFVLFFSGAMASAAPFVNFDFQQARTNSVQPDPIFPFPPFLVGPATDLLPGWQVFRGTDPVPTISYNYAGFDPGVGYVILYDKGFEPERFSLAFCCVDPLQNPNGISIVQRGDVPSDATLLESANLAFTVSANGQNLNRVPRDAQDFSRSAFDILHFAGQNVELRLTFLSPGATYLDNLSFSSAPIIPEPSPLVLVALGALGMFCVRRLRRWRPFATTLGQYSTLKVPACDDLVANALAKLGDS